MFSYFIANEIGSAGKGNKKEACFRKLGPMATSPIQLP